MLPFGSPHYNTRCTLKSKTILITEKISWSPLDVAKAIGFVLVVGLLLIGILGPLLIVIGGDETTLPLLLSVLLEGTFLFAVWLFGPWRYGQSWGALGMSLRLSGSVYWGFLAFMAIFLLSVVYTSLVSSFGLDTLLPPRMSDEFSNGGVITALAFAAIVLVAPFAEEIFFRGFLLLVFVGRMGLVKGACAVSLLFAAGHMSLGLLAPAFVSGMILAWVYYKTGSLWASWIAHMAQNLLAFVATVSSN